LTAPIDDGAIRSVQSPHQAQLRIADEFPRALFSVLLDIPIDSRNTIGSAIREDPSLSADLADLARRATPGLPRPAPSLSEMSRTYRLPLYPDIAELFVGHTTPFQMERVVGWVPSQEFTGIVIYAAEALPLHGTDEQVLLRPALLPELYDTDLRPVIERDMVAPEAIQRWGIAQYVSDPETDGMVERVGERPFRIMAQRAYGVIPTNIMIAPRDADRLLGSEHNRRLLRDGRIVVIVAPQVLDSPDGSTRSN
jgi:hypothetical protein